MRPIVLTAMRDALLPFCRNYSEIAEAFPATQPRDIGLPGHDGAIHILPDADSWAHRYPAAAAALSGRWKAHPGHRVFFWLADPNGNQFGGIPVMFRVSLAVMAEHLAMGRGVTLGRCFPIAYHPATLPSEYERAPAFDMHLTPQRMRDLIAGFGEALGMAAMAVRLHRWRGASIYDQFMGLEGQGSIRPDGFVAMGRDAHFRGYAPTATEARYAVPAIAPDVIERTTEELKRASKCPLCKGSGVQIEGQVSGMSFFVACDCRLGRDMHGPLLCAISNPRGKQASSDHRRRGHVGRRRESVRWHDPEAIERTLSNC